MQTVKILTEVFDGTVPAHERFKVEIYEANQVEYRWYKLSKAEYEHFIKERDGIYVLFDAEIFFKRRTDAGMSEEINFCHLYFYDVSNDRYIQFALIDVSVFIMNSSGQTIDKIYS